MGKGDSQILPVARRQSNGSRASGTFLCQRCSMGVYRQFNFRCVFILIFSLAAFLSALFWVLPIRHRQAGFDAKDSIKLSAAVQAYFKLQKPVSELVPYIARLEYDVNEEIGVPSMKVVVLSMHPASLSNWTSVRFGFLPDPINSTMSSVPLSVLKSSLIDLFFQDINLTLTSQIFGQPSSFEILKFPGGITIIPERTSLMLQTPLFNFTLNSSIEDIRENLQVLKQQLKLELRLMRDEDVNVQLTNKQGSTRDPPVTVQAFMTSDLGPDRLRQLAQIITNSPRTENLGLDHSVFGKVKEISLSSFLNHSLLAPSPTPSPSPCPSPCPSPFPSVDDNGPSSAPAYSPAFSPNIYQSLPPCSNCYTSAPSGATHPYSPSPDNGPHHSLSPTSNSPAPSVAHDSPHCGSAEPPSPSTHPDQVSPRSSIESPLAGSTPQISPSLSPIGTSRDPNGRSRVASSPLSVSIASSRSTGCSMIWWFYWIGLLTCHFLFWIP